MKKIISLFLASVLFILCLASCGTHAAAKTLDAILGDVKEGNLLSSKALENSPFSNEDEEMLTALYKNFDYEIGDVTEVDGTAEVSVKITMTDVGEIFLAYMNAALASEISDDVNEFINMLRADDVTVRTFDITVNMVKTNGEWALAEENAEFTDAITGGLFSSIGGMITD